MGSTFERGAFPKVRAHLPIVLCPYLQQSSREAPPVTGSKVRLVSPTFLREAKSSRTGSQLSMVAHPVLPLYMSVTGQTCVAGVFIKFNELSIVNKTILTHPSLALYKDPNWKSVLH